MTSTTRRMSARLRNSRTSSQASSPVNLSPRVDDSAVGPNGTPKGFAAEKRVASPAPDVCGPRRKSQRLASRSQPENDVLVEDHGSEEGSGKSESSSSSGSDTYEDSGHEQPDERAQRLERRRAGIPASAAEVKVEEQDAQRYPKRERIEISRFEPEPVYPRHMRKTTAHHRGGDTRRAQYRSRRQSRRRRDSSGHHSRRRRHRYYADDDSGDDVYYSSDSSEEYGDGKRHRKRPDGTRSRIETSFLLKRPEQLIADMAGPLDTRVGQPSSLLATGASAGSRGISFLNETIDCSELEGWDAIGGETVRRHIHHVVESVLLPLVYPELFKGLGVSPPRGLLLHGPPGTGKTLLARCLAGSCSRLGGGAKVSFFMRKGADVLSKWVGEGERLLRELFDQARKAQPSIIFFDEIDGLAPVRIGCSGANSSDPVASGGSSHSSSLVATLLALMDGLDGRGEHVVVLAATNRPDAVDPALRRPGRFDKELRFSPPRGAAERRAVLEVHTRKWRSDQMPPGTAAWICDPSRTAGFTGADLKALTEEAVMMAVRRTYPQIYEEAIRQTSGDLNGAKRRSTLRQKFMVSASNVVVTPLDFTAALKKIVPSSRRRSQHATAAGNGNSLAVASPLTSKLFASQITSLCSTILEALGQQEGKDDLNCGGVEVSTESPRKVISRVISPATGVILKTDDPTSILQYVLPGVSLAIQERGVGVFVIDMCGVSTGQQAVLDTVEAALQNTPSLLLITDDVRCVEDRLRAGELEGATSAMIEACTCLSSLLMSRVAVHGSGVLTLVLTHTVVASDADPAPWSADFDVLDMRMDMPVEFVSGWLAELLAEQVEENVRLVQREEHARQCAAVELPKTVYKFEQPSSESSSMKWESLSRKEMDTMRKEEDHWFRILRIQIREILKSLREFPAYRRWFYSPVDLEVYTDYSSIISQPLCLEDMMRKNDSEEYTAVSEVVSDLEIIANNARTYNSAQSQVYASATEFIDRATLKCQCVDDNVVAMCKLMKERRESRETFLTQQSTGQYRSRRLHPDAGLDSPEPTDATHPMEVDEDAPPSFPEAPSPFTISESLRMELKGLSDDLIEQLPKGDGPLWKRALPLAGRIIARLIAAELPTSSKEELIDFIRDALEGSCTGPSRMSCCSNDRLSGS